MQVDKLQPRPERYICWGLQGFGVRVSPTGAKTFVYWFRSGTRKRLMTLGEYDPKHYSLKQALGEHAQAVADAKKKDDPAEKQKAKRAAKIEADRLAALERTAELTVRQVFERWAEIDLAPRVDPDGTRHGRKDGGAALRQQFALRVFPALGDMPIRSVTKGNVTDLLDKTKTEGKRRTASVLFSSLRQMFDFALDRDYIDRSHTVALKKARVVGTPNPRTRTLNRDGDWQLSRLLQRLPHVGMHPVTVLALKFILATGQRPGEVAGMLKAELDRSGTLWTIPAARYKTGQDQKVPLSPYALDLLAQAAAYNFGSDYVFPSPQSLSRALDRHSLSRAVLRKLGTATPEGEQPQAGTLGLEAFTPHDLRRTCRTGLALLKVSEHIAERVIGHKLQGMLAVYNQHDYLPECRDALVLWGEKLSALDANIQTL